jgi:hypothetical protein
MPGFIAKRLGSLYIDVLAEPTPVLSYPQRLPLSCRCLSSNGLAGVWSGPLVNLQTVMSSIMRRRNGLMASADWWKSWEAP